MAVNSDLYLHDSDRAALNALKSIPGFTTLLRAFMNVWNEKQFKIQNMATNIRLDSKQMEKYYNMLPPICEKLGIDVPELYITLDVTPNAYTYGDNNPFIVLHSGLFDVMSDEMIELVLAHECGHIACHHTLYHTMGKMVLNGAMRVLGLSGLITLPIELAFAYWMRCSEFSADRAAIIYAGGYERVVDMCMRFAGYNEKTMDPANVDLFMSQAVEYKQMVQGNMWNKTLEFLSFSMNSHPINAVRAYEAREWVRSGSFARILGIQYETYQQPTFIPGPRVNQNYIDVKDDLDDDDDDTNIDDNGGNNSGDGNISINDGDSGVATNSGIQIDSDDDDDTEIKVSLSKDNEDNKEDKTEDKTEDKIEYKKEEVTNAATNSGIKVDAADDFREVKTEDSKIEIKEEKSEEKTEVKTEVKPENKMPKNIISISIDDDDPDDDDDDGVIMVTASKDDSDEEKAEDSADSADSTDKDATKDSNEKADKDATKDNTDNTDKDATKDNTDSADKDATKDNTDSAGNKKDDDFGDIKVDFDSDEGYDPNLFNQYFGMGSGVTPLNNNPAPGGTPAQSTNMPQNVNPSQFVTVPNAAVFYRGEHFRKVYDEMQALGFTNVELYKKKEGNFFTVPNTVVQIVIDGVEEFRYNEKFPRESRVIIVYYDPF